MKNSCCVQKISTIVYLYTIVEIFVLLILEVNVNLKLYQ